MKKLLFVKGGKRCAMLVMFLMLAVLTFAVPAKPGLKRLLTLTDGTTVTATLVGDEHGHYWLGADGKAYQSTGDEVYQAIDAQAVKQHAAKRRAAANQRRAKRLAPKKVGEVGSISGDKKGIIILVNFTDKAFTATQSDFNKLANQENYNSGNYKGSMYDYFYAQSDGQFRLTFDVVGPYTVSQNCAYYGGNDSNGDDLRPGNMVKEAVQLANNDVNFANYDWDGDGYVDQVYVVYAGKGEADGGDDDTIWPHEWDLRSATGSYITLDGKKINTYACGGEQNGSTGATAGIGTMCHEFSHCLGYPDFYDTDYSGGQGMFEWDLMDSGSYNDNGYRPAGYTSYERWVAGWKTPTTLEATQTISNMKALQTTGSDTYIIYNKGNNNEYYLLENRQKIGWDTDLPGKGLLILHVDYDATVWSNNKPNDTPSHQRMTWVAADNEYQYTTYQGTKYYTKAGAKNDPFPYGSVNSFGKNTTPAASLYNANSNGTYYLDSSVENITQNNDGTITFNFVGISNVATPTFSPAAGQYADAQTVTISCATSGATIYYTLDGTIPSTSSSVYSSALTISETTTVKAIAVKDNEESALATAKYTIGGSSSDPNTKKFKLVTSVSEMKSGMRYIIACGSKNTAAGSHSTSYLSKVDVTSSNDVITITDDVAVFVLEQTNNGWTFQNESTNQYLTSTAAKSVSYNSTASSWTLSNGTAGVIMTYGSCGTMLYNVNSPRFTTYSSDPSSTMIQANLYMEYSDGSTTTTTPELIADPETLSFEAEVNASQVKTFDVLGADLTGNVTISVTEGNSVFSVNPSTITKADAEEGATVSVTFTSTAAGSFTGTVTVSSDGAEPVTVSLTGTATASSTTSSGNEFALITSADDFVEGDYIIVYNNGAMNTTVSSNRLQYTEVTPANNVITTTDASIIWHIAPSGNYYTIYNAGANKYAASTGTKNQAQLLTSGTDDKSLWSVTTGATFEFTNKYNSANSVNAALRRNGNYGFACYATGTGGVLSLYKRTSGSSTTSNYYQPADGKKGSTLKTAMCGIIYNRTQLDYDDLWEAFKTTDVKSNDKIWDMYSNKTEHSPVSSGSSYSTEGDCYNREHSWPQSWFGSNTPMYTDLHHIYPTDGFVNGKRANYPFGETSSPTYTSYDNFSKLGPCSYSGYTGTVFEPADEYKGDFARTYFYMVTCYEEKLNDWYTNYSSTDVVQVINGSTYPAFQTWQLNMLMEWAKNDPVSEKETNRNEAVYDIQGNRNPFIDYPGLQEYIWGNLTTTDFSYDNYLKPVNMYFSEASATATVGQTFTEPSLTILPTGLSVTYSSSNTSVATVNASTGDVTPVAAGETTITATYSGSENYIGSASYTLTVSAAQALPNAPTNLALSEMDATSMTASWTSASNATSYEIDVVKGSSFETSTGEAVLQSNFSDATDWTLSGTGTYTGDGYYGAGSPSIKFDGTGDYAISPDFGSGVKLQFWAYGNGGSGSTFAIKGLVNNTWTDIETVTIAQDGNTYEVDLPDGTSQVRFDFTKSVNCALDDVIVYGPGNSPESVDGYPKSIGNVTSYDITGLTPETQYAVRVRAVNSAGNSDWSSTATATTTVANSAPVWSAFPNASVTVGEDYDLMISDYVSGNPTPTISMTASTANSADYEYDSDGGYFLFVPSEAGTFDFTFRATNSEGTADATLTVFVPVTVPTLATNMEESTSTSVPVSWTACDGVSSYTLQLASDDQFTESSQGSNATLINESFENAIPSSWSASSSNISTASGKGGDGDKCVAFKGANAYLITPQLSNPTNVSIMYKRSSNNTAWGLDVSYSTSTSGPWTSIGTISDATTSWQTFSKSLSNVGNVYIKFTDTRSSGTHERYIDLVQITSVTAPVEGSLISSETVSGTEHTFTGLTSETTYYTRVKGDADWSNVVEFTTNTAISFANNADNSGTIGNAAQTGKRYDATLSDRTLYKDGDWNTLCLPFNMTESQVSSQLASTELKELDIQANNDYTHITGLDGTTLYLNFKDASSIVAGTPYIIKWEKASGYDSADPETRDLKNPTFTGVTISNATNNVNFTGGSFLGTYSYQQFTDENTSILFMGFKNTLYYPQSGAEIGAFRAYFNLNDGNQAREFVLNFGDEEVTTGIFENEELRMKNEELEDGIYDLQGRKMVNGQLKRGLYIVNGKKVVIK